MEAGTRDLVVSVVREHAEGLLRVARRYTACAADAEDAYQRALEIFVRHAHRLDEAGAHKWLYVVVRHEALAVRRARSSLVGVEDEAALDALDDARHVASVEERSERFDDLARAAEALQRLKPQEVTALWLKAEGLSYDEIARRQNWTYTKVNRCITEGRRAFLRRYADIEAGEECERWSGVLSAIADGEATQQQLLEARPHLRNCPACRSSLVAMQRGGRAVAALLPVGLMPADPARVAGRFGELAAAAHDRAQAFTDAVVLKAQVATAATEAAVSGKLAALAATTAVLAGGGVAVERHTGEAPARASAPAARVAPAAEATTPRESSTPDPSSPPPTTTPPSAAPPPARPADASSEGPGAAVPDDAAFAPEAPAERRPPAPAPEFDAGAPPPASDATGAEGAASGAGAPEFGLVGP